MPDEVSAEISHRVENKHLEAKKFAEQKLPQDALHIYDEAIRLAKGDPGLTAWIHFDKGKTLTHIGQFQEAIHEFQITQNTIGENTWIFTELGIAQIGLKKFGDAEQELNHALTLNPDNWEASQGLVRIAQLRQQAELLHVQGVENLRAGEFEAAKKLYQDAINLVGEDNAPWSVFDLGKTYELLGQDDLALQQLEKAKSLLPGVIWPDIEMGNVFLAQKNVTKADEHFHSLSRKFPENDTVGERLGHIQKLREEADYFHREGVRLRNEGNFREAVTQYHQAIDLVGEGNAPWALFDLGLAYRALGRYEESYASLEQAQEFFPPTIWIPVELGNTNVAWRRFTFARENFQTALKMDETNIQAKQGLVTIDALIKESNSMHEAGKHLLDAGEYEKAIAYYDQAIALAGKESAAWSVFDKGVALKRLGQPNKALNELWWAKVYLPNVKWVDIEIGEADIDARRYFEARKMFAEALRLDENDVRAKRGLKIIERNVQEASRIHTGAKQLLDNGDYENAIKAYDQAIALVGKSETPWSLYDKGIAFRKLGRFEESIENLWNASEYIGNNAWIRTQIGETFLASDRYEQARYEFGAALLLDPQNVDAINGLAWIRKHVDKERIANEVKDYSLSQIVFDKKTDFIAAGGEGTIYNIPGMPDHVLKLFNDDYHNEAISDKLKYMIQFPPEGVVDANKHVAITWPTARVVENGKVVGFIMPKVRTESAKLIHFMLDAYGRIYGEEPAKRWYGFNYKYLMRSMLNIAILTEALHKAGYRVGDMNDLGYFVHTNSLITQVDADSLQVPNEQGGTYKCVVGLVEYTAPELLNSNYTVDYNVVERTESSDSFAYAIMLFRGLMNNRSPFYVPGMMMEDLIHILKDGQNTVYLYHLQNSR